MVVLTPNPALADDVRVDEWHLRALNIKAAHQVSTGEDVIVGIVDTGVDPHPDLRRNLIAGVNVLEKSRGDDTRDDNGHGTQMAGLIAAHGRNGDGVLGIAPSAKILPVKDSDDRDNGNSVSTAAGIEWAAANGARVINVSSSSGPSIAMKEAVLAAAAADALIVASSGNKPNFLQFGYPAAVPGVLAVGSSDRSNKHASFSVTGPSMQVCAPGVEIVSTRLNGRYAVANGTSSSTAIVAGAAALVRAKFPNLSAQEVIHRITATATDIGEPGRDDECGYGVLNIVKALTAEVPPPTSTSTPPNTTPPTSAATPDPQPTSNRTATIAAATTAALLLTGSLAYLLTRRRHRTRKTS